LILSSEKYGKQIGSQIFPGIQGGPLMHVIAAKAVAFKEALAPSFVEYQKQVIKNGAVLATVLMERGYKLVSNGTDNHLVLVDFSQRDISGNEAEERLGRANITVNKNTVPNETRSPFVTSGIRIGVPLVTSRGMGQEAVQQIAQYICDILDDEANVEPTAAKVKDLCSQYPLYAKIPK
jgi:glycine hydroxymethyltransferase